MLMRAWIGIVECSDWNERCDEYSIPGRYTDWSTVSMDAGSLALYAVGLALIVRLVAAVAVTVFVVRAAKVSEDTGIL